METTTVKLTGLSCAACQKMIEKLVKKIDGVESVDVDLSTGETQIKAVRKITNEQITEALAKSHYKVVN